MAESLRPVLSRRPNFSLYYSRVNRFLSLLAIVLSLAVAEVSASQVRVPEGTFVSLALRSDVTTENVVKGDRVDFDVVKNVVVDGYVVIPKGAAGWATVVKVKGAGKKDTKDASVTLRIKGVNAIDQQPIPLRLIPNRSKKLDPSENDSEESGVIPGNGERMIGAAKGKQYAAYTDIEALVNAPDNAPPLAAQPASSQTVPGAAAFPAKTPAPLAQPDALLAPEPATVDFRSDPTGGEILIDGSSVGVTPTTLQLAPGLHDLEIHVNGYQSWKRKMRVTRGSHPTVLAHMVKE
jgi:PEGA domain